MKSLGFMRVGIVLFFVVFFLVRLVIGIENMFSMYLWLNKG